MTNQPTQRPAPEKVAVGGSLVPTPRVNAVIGRVLSTLDHAAGAGIVPRPLPATSVVTARGQALRLLQDSAQPVLLPADEGLQASIPEATGDVVDAFERFAALRPQAFTGLDPAQRAYARGALVLLIRAVQTGALTAGDVPAALQLIAAAAAQHRQAAPTSTSATSTPATVVRPPTRTDRDGGQAPARGLLQEINQANDAELEPLLFRLAGTAPRSLLRGVEQPAFQDLFEARQDRMSPDEAANLRQTLTLARRQALQTVIIRSLAQGQSRSSIAKELGIYGSTFSRDAVPKALEWAAPGVEGELAALSHAIDTGLIAIDSHATVGISPEQARLIRHAAAQNLPALTMDHLLALQGAANGWDDITIAGSLGCTKSNARNLLKQASAALGIDGTQAAAKASTIEAAQTLGLVAPLAPEEAMAPELIRLLRDLAQTHSLGSTAGEPIEREPNEHRAQLQRAAKVLGVESDSEYDLLASAIRQGVIHVSSTDAADIESIAALRLPGLKVDAVRMLRQMAAGRDMRGLLQEFQRSRVRMHEGELRSALDVQRPASPNKSELVDKAMELGLLNPQSPGSALGEDERQVLIARARQEPLDAMAARLGVSLHWVGVSAMPTIRRAFAAANGNEFLALQRAIDAGVIPVQPAAADGLTVQRVQQIRRLAVLDLPIRLEHELELDGLAHGLGVMQISRRVGLPQSAISKHLEMLRSLAQVESNSALVAWADQRELLGNTDLAAWAAQQDPRGTAQRPSAVKHVPMRDASQRFPGNEQAAIRQAAAQRLVEQLTARFRSALRMQEQEQEQESALSVVELGSSPSWVAAGVREQLGSQVGTVSVDKIDPGALPQSQRFGYVGYEDAINRQTLNAIREQLRQQTGTGRASDVVLSFSLAGQPYEKRRELEQSSELLRDDGRLHILQPSKSFSAAGRKRFNEAIRRLGLEVESQEALGAKGEVLLLQLRKDRPPEPRPLPLELFRWSQ